MTSKKFLLFFLTFLLIISASNAFASSINSFPGLGDNTKNTIWDVVISQNQTHSINGSAWTTSISCENANWTVFQGTCQISNGSLETIQYGTGKDFIVRTSGIASYAGSHAPTGKGLNDSYIATIDWLLHNNTGGTSTYWYYLLHYFRGGYTGADPTLLNYTVWKNVSGGCGVSTCKVVEHFNITGSSVQFQNPNFTSLTPGWHTTQIEYVKNHSYTIYFDEQIGFQVIGDNLSKLGILEPQILALATGAEAGHKAAFGNITFYKEGGAIISSSILDEKNKQVLPLVFDIEIVGSSSYDFSQTNNFSTLLTPGAYRITYSALNFPNRDYYLNVVYGENQGLQLYALDDTNSTEVSYIIKDESFKPLENATIQALRYYSVSNSYEVVEMDLSGFDGSGILNLEQDNAFYKFRVLYNGDTKLDTVGTTINSLHVANGLNFQINTLVDTLADVEALQGAAASINFNTASNSFTFSSTDSGGVYDQACLEIVGVTQYTNKVVNTSCTTSDSSTIVIVVDNTTNTQYFAQGILIKGENEVVVSQSTKIFDSNGIVDIIGGYGIFLTIFIVMLMGLATLYNPKSTIITGSLGFAIPIFAGFSVFSVGLAILMFLGGIIVSYVIRLGEE